MSFVVSIHQPEYLPWLGFLEKLDQSDIFVLLDTVQFRKNYFQNRNKIRVGDGWRWLTVPVVKGPHSRRLNEMEIANDRKWRREHWNLISLYYRNAPHFSEVEADFEEVYEQPWEKLVDLNVQIIRTMAKCLGIETKLVVASELGLDWGVGGTEVNLNICKFLKAEVYLSGQFGRNYLDEEPFAEAGIQIAYQSFQHPVYQQRFEPFAEGMSAIDFLFAKGGEGIQILREANVHARG